MSASSQATGTNDLKRVFGSGQTAIVLAFWAKARFDKDNYGEIACLETTAGGGANRIVGIQQDTNGSGTGDTFEGFSYNAAGAFTFTPTLVSTSDVWRFFCIVFNSSTAVTMYVGTETGSLTSHNLTADFNVNVIDEAVLANDNATELCDCSYWGVRLWLGWSPSSGDITAERDSVTGAPVHTADLDSHIQCATGTNPEVATTGTNWTRTGTFTTDASNPALGGGTDIDPGISTETDAAFAPILTKTLATGRSDSSETALARTLTKSINPAVAETIEIAHALTLTKSFSPGIATETDTAFSTYAGGLSPGLSAESESALAPTLTKTAVTGISPESDTALPRTLTKTLVTGLSTESDTALQPATLRKSFSPGVATETEVVLSLTFTKAMATGLATESDSSIAPTLARTLTPGIAVETDTALARTLLKTIAMGLSQETDLAIATSLTSGFGFSASTETDTALAPTMTKFIGTGLSTEAETVLSLSWSKSMTPGIATESDVSFARTLSKAFGIGLSEELDSAFSTFPGQTQYINVGLCVETDGALSMTLQKTLQPSFASSGEVSISLSFSKSMTLGIAVESDVALSPYTPVPQFPQLTGFTTHKPRRFFSSARKK